MGEPGRSAALGLGDAYRPRHRLIIETAAGPHTTTIAGPSTTRPVGSPVLSDTDAAAYVRRTSWEPRPANSPYNQRVPTAEQLATYYTSNQDRLGAYGDRVTGGFTGTTDEILQWAAWKWGLDEDVLRGVAAIESWWYQEHSADFVSGVGDTSFGLMSVRKTWPGSNWAGWPGTYPLSIESTPFNVDFYGAAIRYCYDGGDQYMDYIRAEGYVAGDLWGCLGWWYSGHWHDVGAEEYVATVKSHVQHRVWERPGF
jgi:hypothetical protein